MNKKVEVLKITLIVLIAAAALVTYFSVLFGNQNNSRYYFGLVLSAVILIIAWFIYQVRVRYKNLINIKENWGQRINRKRKFQDLKDAFEKHREGFYIDDQTWEDLNLEDIFSMIDRTYSTPGEQVLYDLIRRPSFDKEVLNQRKTAIEYFQNNAEIREKIQMELLKLDRSDIAGLNSLLYEGIEVNKLLGIAVLILSLLPILVLCSIPFAGMGSLKYIIGLFIINMIIHYKLKNITGGVAKSSRYLGNLVKTAQNLSSVQGFELKNYKSILKKSYEDCKRIVKSAGSIGYIEGVDAIFDYVKIMFLIEERGFFETAHEIEKYKEELKKLYFTIGELDALISIASYRDGMEYYCIPEFSEKERYIKFDEVSHPLIEDAVSNSIEIDNHGIVITGSNMSGKSTFLRTIGVNAVMAQTIVTCKARSYKGGFFRTITSISPEDNILSGKSYYLGEAEALLRIIRNLDETTPVLCIIDEIFRGTNPVERISASLEILKYLIERKCIPVVATHDLELTEMVGENYKCYYFTENVDENEGLKFDYTIRQGVSPTRNAIKLLKYLGYPEEIVKNALQGVK